MTDVVHMLHFTRPALLRSGPQIGEPKRWSWDAFTMSLSKPMIATSKDAAGGFAFGRYKDNHRAKAALVDIGALVVDLDGNAAVDRIAEEVSAYSACIVETFTSTAENPRARLILRLEQPIDVETYERAHGVLRAKLRAIGCAVDEGARDASRLSYAPVRRPGATYAFCVTKGKAFDARKLVAQLPPKAKAVVVLPAPEHRDAYLRGALRRAADEVARANEGSRHSELNAQAYSLARLGLSAAEIAAALMPAWVAAAGERRRSEGTRTIRDACRARGAA